MPSLSDLVKSKISYHTFYGRFFEISRKSKNYVCPFHNDNKPSFSISFDDGLWYCHTCQVGGDIFKFWQKKYNVDFKIAFKEIANEFNIDLPKSGHLDRHIPLLKKYNENLFISLKCLKKVMEKRLWDKATIQKYEIGVRNRTEHDKQVTRLTVPVYNETNRLVNIRYWDIFHATNDKFLGEKGHNKPVLYPITKLTSNLVFLLKESDVLLAIQLGFPAVSVTGGEGVFPKTLSPFFKDKDVYICYDIDETGQIGAAKVALLLKDVAKSVYITSFPVPGLPKDGDFTDFIRLRGIGSFNKLIKSTEAVDFTALELFLEPEGKAGELKKKRQISTTQLREKWLISL